MAVSLVSVAGGGEAHSAALVRAAIAGDANAKHALFSRYASQVFRLVHRLLPEEDPKDLAQDVWVDVFSSLSSLRTPEAFPSWVRSIAVVKVKRRLRVRFVRGLFPGARSSEIDLDALIHPHAPPDVHLEAAQLYDSIQALPAEERMAIVLRRVEGLSLSEVAQTMKVSLATAKRRIARASSLLELERSDA